MNAAEGTQLAVRSAGILDSKGTRNTEGMVVPAGGVRDSTDQEAGIALLSSKNPPQGPGSRPNFLRENKFGSINRAVDLHSKGGGGGERD